MTQNWQHIRPIVLSWTVAMFIIAAYFAFSLATCDVTGCATRTMVGMNVIGLSAVTVACLVTVVALMKANAVLLFTPLIAYAGSCALFYGFGPMANFLASPETIAFQSQSYYAIGPAETLRTNLLTTFGISISLIVIYLTMPKSERTLPPQPKIGLGSTAILFVVVGLVLKHGLIMPSVYGTGPWRVPGILENLRYLPDVGFALMAMLGASGRRKWAIAFWLIWPLHFLLAFPEFSKKSVMLTMILPAVGAYISHRSFKRLMLWVIPAAAIFAFLQNTNSIARQTTVLADRDNIALGVEDRLEILGDAALAEETAEARLPIDRQGVATWWLRLNYSGPQSAAMELYDGGVTSDFTQNALIYVVPRFIWPDKPIIASPGMEFHQIVTQNPNSETRVGITVFADGYWKMGWFGVALFASLAGLIISIITRMTMNHLIGRLYLYLPAAALGLQMGAQSHTAFFQNAFLSALPVYFGYCIAVSLVYSQIRQMRQVESSRAAVSSMPNYPGMGAHRLSSN